MRKLTPEERAAKKSGLETAAAEVAAKPAPKKKAKKSESAEPTGIGSDSFRFVPKAEVAEEKAAEDGGEQVEDSGHTDSLVDPTE